MLWFLKKRTTDRRRSPRVRFPSSRSQLVVRSLNDGQILHPRILDIGTGGFRFRGDSRRGRVYKGDRVEIELLFTMGDIPVKIPGEVVWFQVLGNGLQYEGGVRFGKMTPEVLQRMDEFVKKVQSLEIQAGLDSEEYVI